MRHRGLLLSATLFALSLLIPSLSGSSVYADEKSVVGAGNGIRSVSAIGRAPLQLQCNPDLPCSFSTEYKTKIPRESGTLLSIDSIYLKGKTEREIEKLLQGPIGSTAEIGALDTYGALKIIELEREKLSRANGDALKDLNRTISLLDYERNVFEVDSRRAEDAEAQNLDLLTRAYSNSSVQDALSLPGPKSSAVGLLAARAVIVSDTIGDLSAADHYLQLVLKNPEIDWRINDVNADSYKLVTHLITTGQVKEAEVLCRDYIEIAERNGKKQRIGYSQVQRNLQILRELLLQVLMAKKGEKPNKEASAVARELVDDVTSEKNGFWTSDSLHRLARSLEELCDYKRSCQIYAYRLKNERLKDGPNEDPHPGLQRVRDYCDDAYHLAQLQEKLGQPDQAIETAKKALEDYNLFLKAEQQTFAEQLDNYFPAGSDLELLLARLYLNSKKFDLARDLAQKSVKHIETALGPKSALIAKSLDLSARADDGLGQKSAATEARKRLAALERPSSFVETSDSEKFVLLRTASTAVEKGDAKNSINRLVEIYDRQGPVRTYKRRALNLLTSLIGLSRRLTDKGRFAESDALLEKIAAISARDEFTPVADKFIEVEKAYNRACRKKEAHVTWPQLAPEIMVSQLVHESGIPQPVAMRLNPELSKQENLRVLAEIYGDGGETKRAEFFMNRAIAASDRALSAAQSGSAVASSLVARTKIILLLDAARIRARARRLDEAHEFGARAVSLSAATPLDKGPDIGNFNEKYRFKIVELAKTFKNSGESDKAVAQFLKVVRGKLESGATADMPIDERVSRFYGGYYSLIDTYLAQLLFSSGQAKEALPVVRKAVEECGNNVGWALRFLAGQIMEENHLYGEAAHQYVEGSQSGPMNIPMYRNQMELLTLRAAAACAEKDNHMVDSERANIYMRLATRLESEAPKQTLDLYQKALALIPDSDPGKSRLLQRISNLRNTITWVERTATVEKDKAGQSPEALTPDEVHALAVSAAKASLEGMRKQSILNENNLQPHAAFSWFQLAQTESNAEMPEKAVEDFRHGLQIYEKTANSTGFYSGMVASRIDTIPSFWQAKSLSKLGHAKDGEDLIKESIQSTTTVFGSDSPVTAIQLAELFSFYIDQKRDVEALKVLDQLLDLSMSTFVVGQPSASEQVQNRVEDLVRDKRRSLALKILDKELAAEKKSLDFDDKRIADTLSAIAKLQDDAGQTGEAEQNLTDALKIYTKYVGAINLASTPGAYIVQIWKKNGQPDADKAFKLRHIAVNTALLRKFGSASLADRIEKNDKWPEGLVDPNFSQEYGHTVARDAPIVEQIAWWHKELQDACVEAPYSRRSEHAAGYLMDLALQQRNWQILAESAILAAQIYEHTPDSAAGRHSGCVPPDHTRMQYYSNAILAHVHMDKLDDAQKWIDRADKRMACKTCYEYIQLAIYELDCGDRSKAQKFAELADANFTEQYAAVVPDESFRVWKLLGHPERADALKKKAAEFRAKNDAQSKQAQSSAFKNVGF